MRKRLIMTTAMWAMAYVPASASEFIPLGDVHWVAAQNGKLAVSDDGQVVVGAIQTFVGGNARERGFIWSASEGRRVLPINDWLRGAAVALSSDGAIAVGGVFGTSEQPGILPRRGEAVTWINDELISIGANGYVNAGAGAISSDGTVIAGTFEHGTDNSRAFRWTDAEGFHLLGRLPGTVHSEASDISSDGSVIVGESEFQPFIWTAESGMRGLGSLPGVSGTHSMYGVSADGTTVVGSQWDNELFTQEWDEAAWRWTESEGMVRLVPNTEELRGYVPRRSSALDVTADGSIIVGWSNFPDFRPEFPGSAMFWNEEGGLQNMQRELIDQHGLESELNGWRLRYATAISPDGKHIVGSAYDPRGREQAYLVHLDHALGVPEPSTIGMLIVGAILAIGTRRERQTGRLQYEQPCFVEV